MEINRSDENLKILNYDLYIFDEDRIVKTIDNLLCGNSYCYIDYGNDYDYDFNYKNIFVNISYRQKSSNFRSDNCQSMTIKYDNTKINTKDLDFIMNSFHFLLEKTEKYDFSVPPENIYKIDEIIKDMCVEKLIKGNICFLNAFTSKCYNCQYRFEYNNIEVAIKINDEYDEYDSEEYDNWDDYAKDNNIENSKQFILLTYADNEEKIDKNDIEIIKNKFIFL